jgi:hypothetical protein
MYFLLIFMHAMLKTMDINVAVLAVPASFIQLFAYGIGFLTEGWKRLSKG